MTRVGISRTGMKNDVLQIKWLGEKGFLLFSTIRGWEEEDEKGGTFFFFWSSVSL